MNSVVYHYTSIDILDKILRFKKLRFSEMNSLNDKSEYQYGIQLLKDRIVEFEEENNVSSPFEISMLDRFSFRDSLFSISFTEYGDDLAFWNSYYVDKEKSVSIGFTKDSVFNDNFIINQCIYGNPYPKMSRERYNWFRKIFDLNTKLSNITEREYLQITFQTAHIKQKAFKIENEFRSVSFCPKDKELGEFTRNGKSVRFFDQSFQVNSISEIIIGPSVKQISNFMEVRSLIDELGLDIEIKRSAIPLEL
ncbi:hypothetical protein [Sphingobacterium bambusae]|uniref:DUF2971 domain-containing protein n=1 Tax=Sphingobacterium bambusae TaxID=662858 RepID=A0ABW6B9R9_9SPHI|nr:hypothetical protein [Sphingobacterium bambusae]WPL48550.1 hypothetical protein SCB77_21615 [Sphingobacterium bambusae]